MNPQFVPIIAALDYARLFLTVSNGKADLERLEGCRTELHNAKLALERLETEIHQDPDSWCPQCERVIKDGSCPECASARMEQERDTHAERT